MHHDGFHQRAARCRIPGPDLGHYGHRCLHHLQNSGRCRSDGGRSFCTGAAVFVMLFTNGSNMAVALAGGGSGRYGGGTGHRTAPYPLRDSRHSCRHSHPAGPLVGKPGDYGYEGHRGHQCHHAGDAGQASGLPAVRAGRGQGYPSLLSPPDLCGGHLHLAIILLLYWFFGTELGCALRATGSNANMARAQGINTDFTKVRVS